MHGIHLCVVWVGLYWKAVDLHIVRISANQLSGDLHGEWCILGDGKEDQLGTAALDIPFFQCNQTIGDVGHTALAVVFGVSEDSWQSASLQQRDCFAHRTANDIVLPTPPLPPSPIPSSIDTRPPRTSPRLTQSPDELPHLLLLHPTSRHPRHPTTPTQRPTQPLGTSQAQTKTAEGGGAGTKDEGRYPFRFEILSAVSGGV